MCILSLADPRSGPADQLRLDGRARRLPNHGARPTLRVLVHETSALLHAVHVVRAAQPGHRQVRVHLQQLQVARGDALPLHRVRRLRPVRALPREGRPPAQDGEARPRHRRGLFSWRHEASQPSGGPQAVHPALHPVSGARVPVPRRQLPLTVLPEDEARRHAHQDLSPQDQGRLSNMQAAHRVVLLPREALPGDQVFRAFLQQHQAEAEAAAGPATSAASQATAQTYGGHEHARGGTALPSAHGLTGLPSALQTCHARVTAQCAESVATGMYFYSIIQSSISLVNIDIVFVYHKDTFYCLSLLRLLTVMMLRPWLINRSEKCRYLRKKWE